MPFLQTAAMRANVTLLAKPHAAPLLARFAPKVEHLPIVAPWTAFSGKYLLHRWPWRELGRACRQLRERQFTLGVSARPDPRDHALLLLANASHRIGFHRRGSGVLLQRPLPPPTSPHRAANWQAIAHALHWDIAPPNPAPRNGRHIVIHPGAAHPARIWPRDRFEILATRLRDAGWSVSLIDEKSGPLGHLMDTLQQADRFIGNDSGPGHLAALLGVPTFTLFGPQLPERFVPQHPQANWIEGTPCAHRPCHDACRFASPHCILDHEVDHVWTRVKRWLDHTEPTRKTSPPP